MQGSANFEKTTTKNPLQTGISIEIEPDKKSKQKKPQEQIWVTRFTGKTRITGKAVKISERPKNIRELKYIHYIMPSDVRTCLWRKSFLCLLISNIIVFFFKYLTISSNLVYSKK